MEVIVDPNRETGDAEPVVLSSFNVTKAIKDSIQLNFGECGLASSLISFQGMYLFPVFYSSMSTRDCNFTFGI
jgi:ribonuclease P/MRP protein subunit POP5